MKATDLTGKRVGRLTVIERVGNKVGNGGRSRIYWKCKCDCGNFKEIVSTALSTGITKSCGCILNEMIAKVNYKHGEANKTRENKIWQHMISRCNSPSDRKYKNYGGRGIKVCERWQNSYENFLKDMGRCPEKYSIHRIDNDGDYCPENCKWASNDEQANCKTTNVFLEYNGETLTMAQWAKKLGYDYKWFHAQLKYKNITLEELINGRI